MGYMELNSITRRCCAFFMNTLFFCKLRYNHNSCLSEYDSNTKIKKNDVLETFQFIDHMISNAIEREDCFKIIICMLKLENNTLLLSIDNTKAACLEYYISYLEDEKNNTKIKKHLIDVKKYLSINPIEFITRNKIKKRKKNEIRLILNDFFYSIIDLEIESTIYNLGKILCEKKDAQKTFLALDKRTKVYHIFNYYKIALNFILDIIKSCIIHDLQIDGIEI